MKLRVKLFAAAKERAGRDVVVVEVADDATLSDLRRALIECAPELAPIVPHALWAVDMQYAPDETRLAEYNEIALIPPVSGG